MFLEPSCLCQFDMWDAQLYILENTVRPMPNMLPGMVGAVKHSSKLCARLAASRTEKEDKRNDAWGAVAASVEGDDDDGSPEESGVSDDDGDGGDDRAGGDGELELLLDAVMEPAPKEAGDTVAAGVEEAVVDLDVGSGDAPLGGDGDVPPVPDPVAHLAVPVPGAAPRAPRRAPHPQWQPHSLVRRCAFMKRMAPSLQSAGMSSTEIASSAARTQRLPE